MDAMGKPSQEKMSMIRGGRRAQHFANGGSLTAWRGGNAIRQPDGKKAASKAACRGQVRDHRMA